MSDVPMILELMQRRVSQDWDSSQQNHITASPAQEGDPPLELLRNGTLPTGQTTAPFASVAAPEDWLVWQLVDSSFPTGGFAHSGGLEAAWQQGEVASRTELISFLQAALRQSGRAALPFVTASWKEPGRLADWDELFDAFTSNHVANRASRAQGKAFLAAIVRVFDLHLVPRQCGADSGQCSPGHWPIVFGATLRRLGVDHFKTLRLFCFHNLRGPLAAAVRLNIIGPLEAQRVQRELAGDAEAILRECAKLNLESIAQTEPLLDLWQGAQDRLYSRLFQS